MNLYHIKIDKNGFFIFGYRFYNKNLIRGIHKRRIRREELISDYEFGTFLGFKWVKTKWPL